MRKVKKQNSHTAIFVIQLKTVLLYVLILLVLCSTVHIYVTREDTTVSAAAKEKSGIHIPILMYHGITEDESRIGKFVISKKMFEDDISYIENNGYETVTINQVIDYVKEGKELPEKPIILTFDDGYYNNYYYAFPILKEKNMKAVISPIGKYIDVYTENPDRNVAYAHMGWDEIKEMMQSGLIEFQNHSYDLHHNTDGRNGAKKKGDESLAAYGKFLENDLMTFQKKMYEYTGYKPTTFTYPYGGISDASYEILEKMGFEATLSCEEKINVIVKNDQECLRKLNRFLRSDTKSAEQILENVGE